MRQKNIETEKEGKTIKREIDTKTLTAGDRRRERERIKERKRYILTTINI